MKRLVLLYMKLLYVFEAKSVTLSKNVTGEYITEYKKYILDDLLNNMTILDIL